MKPRSTACGRPASIPPVLSPESLLVDVLDSVQDGISILTPDMTILWVNPKMEQWYSDAMPLVGKKCFAAYHGRQAPCAVCPSQHSLTRRIPARGIVPRLDAARTLVGWLEFSTFPLIDGITGELKGVVEYARDVSVELRFEEELRHTHEELRQRTAELEATNKELETYSYSVSHDLRIPLASVRGFCDLIALDEENALSARGRGFLDRVRASIQQMSDLVDVLLDFSHVSRRTLQVQTVDPDPLVRQTIDDLQCIQGSRQIDWVLGNLPPCQADPTLLKQVYSNLLANALKFTRRRANARIEVGSVTENGRTVYVVRDNGIGFTATEATRLFRPFYRVNLTRDYEGHGLGLALVHRILARHGGSVWAEGIVDSGATFFFSLRPGLEPPPATMTTALRP